MGANSKLEECARALCELEGGKWDARHMGETMSGNDPEDARENYREQARAVISCLMEPDETMLKEFRLWDAVSGPSYGSDDYAVESLRAMLQSVLDEGK